MHPKYERLLDLRFGYVGARILRGGTYLQTIKDGVLGNGCRSTVGSPKPIAVPDENAMRVFGEADRILYRLSSLHALALERAYGDAGHHVGAARRWELVAPLTAHARRNAEAWLARSQDRLGHGDHAERWVKHALTTGDERLPIVRAAALALLEDAETAFSFAATCLERDALLIKQAGRARR